MADLAWSCLEKERVAAEAAQVAPRRTAIELDRKAGVWLKCPPGDMPFAAWLALTKTLPAVAGEYVAAFQGARSRLAQQQAGLDKVHRTRRGL